MNENDKQAEPVAWVRRHPDGALTAEFLEDAVIEPVRKKSGAWAPLYTHPAPAVAVNEQMLKALKACDWHSLDLPEFVRTEVEASIRAAEAEKAKGVCDA